MDKLGNKAEKYLPVVECVLKKDSNPENIQKCLAASKPKIPVADVKKCEEVSSIPANPGIPVLTG